MNITLAVTVLHLQSFIPDLKTKKTDTTVQ